MRTLGYSVGAIVFLIVVCAAVLKILQYTVGGGYYSLPSSSMMPTFRPKETVIALPLIGGGLPDRGDVILFDKPNDPGVTYIFRLIGLPGDRISVTNGKVTLNGTVLAQEKILPFPVDATDPMNARFCIGQAAAECALERWTEKLPDGRSFSVLDLGETRLDTFSEMLVPDGHVFVLGDNRDNAVDSRFPTTGLVPAANISGVAWLRLIGQGKSGFSWGRSVSWVE